MLENVRSARWERERAEWMRSARDFNEEIAIEEMILYENRYEHKVEV